MTEGPNTEQAINIALAVENQGWTLRPTYSGRGMYGNHCLGVVSPAGDAARALICLAEALEEEGLEQAAELVKSRTASVDSMGLDTIFYWQDLQVSPDFNEADYFEREI